VWLLALVGAYHRAPPAPLAPRVGGSLRWCRACACSLVGLPPLKLSHECISLSPSHTHISKLQRETGRHPHIRTLKTGAAVFSTPVDACPLPYPLPYPHTMLLPLLSCPDIDEALGVSTLDKLRGKLGVASAMVGFTYSVSAGVRFVVRLLGRCDAESKRVTNAVRPGGGGAWRSKAVAMCACECVR
jgi:hypothetical protein